MFLHQIDNILFILKVAIYAYNLNSLWEASVLSKEQFILLVLSVLIMQVIFQDQFNSVQLLIMALLSRVFLPLYTDVP